MRHATPIILLCWALAALVGCDDDAPEATAAAAEAVSFEHHECAACGMIVRDQPAPRGQLVHRDGTRVFFCAISDLVTYVGAPSPHGEPSAIWVETLEADATPDRLTTDEQRWSTAQDASFVVGDFSRPVMGRPVLTFADRSIGASAASRLDGRELSWSELITELSPDHTH